MGQMFIHFFFPDRDHLGDVNGIEFFLLEQLDYLLTNR